MRLTDAPKAKREIGQVVCVSRLNSDQRWDEIVGRLRIGIWARENGDHYMDLMLAQPKEGGLATRRKFSFEEMEARIGFCLSSELMRVGAKQIGTRQQVTGDTGQRRDFPCVTFAPDDLLTLIAAWVGVTVAPLLKP